MESKEEVKSINNYSLKHIIKSSNKLFKYSAILSDDSLIHFGCSDRDGVPFEQYHDRTGLGLYTDYDNYNVVKAKAWYLKNKTYINKQFWTSKGLEFTFLQKVN